MLDSTKLQTIKNGLPLISYVRDELQRRSKAGPLTVNVDKNLVSEIITNNPDAKSKLPADTTVHESIYKAIAAQIKISTIVSGKGSLSKDELLQLMKEPVVSEAIQETGISADKVSEILGNHFDILTRLLAETNSTSPLSKAFALSIVTELKGVGITDEELNELSHNKKIPLSALPKLSKLTKDSYLGQLMGDSLSFFELLPLLLDSTMSAIPPIVVSEKEKKEPKKEEKVGWGNGYGKWILGGSSVVLAGIGLFVEDNIIKTFLIGLGALGLGGTLASNIEGVQTMFGAPTKS